MAKARKQIKYIQDEYFQFLESPAAMKYQVEAYRQEILAQTDEIEQFRLEKLLLTRDEIDNLAPKVKSLYYGLLNAEADLNMMINSDALHWRCIGPPRGGRVVAVAGDYQNTMTFYFGACAGGIWKTSDG